MSVLPSWNRYPGRFTIVLGAMALLFFILEHINGRFWLNDFRVYYGAGEAILNGHPIYGVAHGLDTGVFKYAPLLALVYALFALLPYGVAASIQYLLITLAFLDGIRRVDRMVREQLLGRPVERYLPLLITAVVCVVHLQRELHLGNINMMLLWLLVVALGTLLEGRPGRAGLLLGAAMLAKPHFVVLLPLLTIHRKWPTLAMVLVTIIAGLMVPALFLGWSTNLDVHMAWLKEMASHNATLIYTGGDDHRAVNTIYSFLHRGLLDRFLAAPTPMETALVLAVVAGLFGLFVLNNLRTGNGDRSFAFEFLALVALVPCITLTDTEHFLLAMPIVSYLVHRSVPRARPVWLPLLSVPLLLCYGGNWADALGRISDRLVHYGILGIGTAGMLVLAILLWHGSDKRPGPRS